MLIANKRQCLSNKKVCLSNKISNFAPRTKAFANIILTIRKQNTDNQKTYIYRTHYGFITKDCCSRKKR